MSLWEKIPLFLTIVTVTINRRPQATLLIVPGYKKFVYQTGLRNKTRVPVKPGIGGRGGRTYNCSAPEFQRVKRNFVYLNRVKE